MKNVIVASMIISMSVVVLGFSQQAEAKKKSNPSYSKAKQDCLTENASLKGKALQKCIKKSIRKG